MKRVRIPDSELGRSHGVGIVVRQWSDHIAVEFTDNAGRKLLGHYTVSKHQIEEVT